MVGAVSNVEIAVGSKDEAEGEVEGCAAGDSILIAHLCGACERGDFAQGVDLDNPVVAPICNVNIAFGADSDVGGFFESDTSAGRLNCCDPTCRRNFADQVVAGVGDEHIARGIEREAGWVLKLCRCAESVEAAGYAAACEGYDLSKSVDFADAVVVCVCHIDVAGAINDNVSGLVESCGCAVSVSQAGCAVSCECAHGAVGSNFTNAVIALVGDEEVSRWIERDAVRIAKSNRRFVSVF